VSAVRHIGKKTESCGSYSVLEEVTKNHASPRSLHVGLRLRVTVSCGLI